MASGKWEVGSGKWEEMARKQGFSPPCPPPYSKTAVTGSAAESGGGAIVRGGTQRGGDATGSGDAMGGGDATGRTARAVAFEERDAA